MSSDGGEILQLIFDKDRAHSFSPGGDKIVFAGQGSRASSYSQFYTERYLNDYQKSIEAINKASALEENLADAHRALREKNVLPRRF